MWVTALISVSPIQPRPTQRSVCGNSAAAADRQPDVADIHQRHAAGVDRPVVAPALEHMRIGELPEAARPQMLFGLVQHVDHQQGGEDRLFGRRIVAEQRDPDRQRDDGEHG